MSMIKPVSTNNDEGLKKRGKPTYRPERSKLYIRDRLEIVHRHSAILEARSGVMVRHLRHPKEAPVPMFEIHDSRPVV